MVRLIGVFTPVRVAIVVLKRDNAKGRRVTQVVRRGDGQTGGPFIALSYNALGRRLTTSALLKRRGNTFAKTSCIHINIFRRTGKKALFLSRVNGLSLRIRGVLLQIIRRRQFEQINKAGSVRTSIHLILTAGRSLNGTIGGSAFGRSLLRQLYRAVVRLPPLQRTMRSIEPLTRFFLEECGLQFKGRVSNFDAKTVGTLRACA